MSKKRSAPCNHVPGRAGSGPSGAAPDVLPGADPRPFRLNRTAGGRSLGTALVLALPFICIGKSASAQLLDQYFPQGIPGYETGLGVTVQSRPRTEYEPTTVRLGSFILTPEASQGIGYNDNVAGQPKGQGSAELETKAALGINSDWSRNSLNAYLSVDNLAYPSFSSQNQTNWTASIGGRYDLGRDQIKLAYTHFNLHQTPTEIGSQVSNPLTGAIAFTPVPLAYRVDDFRASYNTQFGRFTLTPNVEYSIYNYDNGVFNGTPIIESINNREVVLGGLTTRYEFAPQRNVLLVVNGFNVHYTSKVPVVAGVPSQPGRDSYGAQILAGLEYTASAVFRYRLLIGFEQRDYVSPAIKAQSAPIAEGTVIWTPTDLTTVTGSVIHSLEDATAGTTAAYTYTGARVVVDHEYRRNILLQGYAGVEYADYPQGGGTQTITNAGANVTWLINRKLRLTGSYDFTNSTATNTTSPVPNFPTGNYMRNIYLLTLRVAL